MVRMQKFFGKRFIALTKWQQRGQQGVEAQPYLFNGTEGRPGLKSILWSKTSFRIHCPVPAVIAVVIEVCVTIMGVIRIPGEPAFFDWLQAIGGTGYHKRTTLIFLGYKKNQNKTKIQPLYKVINVYHLNIWTIFWKEGLRGRETILFSNFWVTT